GDEQFVYCPLVYGYVSYVHSQIEFSHMPSMNRGSRGARGSTLGGTGVAVSARSSHRDAALAVAFDLASSQTQRTVSAKSGGQPAHRDAWTDDAVNSAAKNFYRSTLATLDGSYCRPRFDGYVVFQHAAGELVQKCLRGKLSISSTVGRLNELFGEAQ